MVRTSAFVITARGKLKRESGRGVTESGKTELQSCNAVIRPPGISDFDAVV
jgi:hypothetical protein